MFDSLVRSIVLRCFDPKDHITHLVYRRNHGRIRLGPFAGMRYTDTFVATAGIPTLLGIYERELHSCVESICAAKPKLVVNIGGGDGYYAVGLALKNPQAQVVAFEINPVGRKMIYETAQLNGVEERVRILNQCEPEDLQKALDGAEAPVVVCDVEGYEEVLLDPLAVPALRGATILAEMHDIGRTGMAEELQTRFQPTHRIDRIWQEDRNRSEFPYKTLTTRLLPKSYLDWAVSEWRGSGMSWLWMVPRPVKDESPVH